MKINKITLKNFKFYGTGKLKFFNYIFFNSNDCNLSN